MTGTVKDATIEVLPWRARWIPFLRTADERMVFAGLYFPPVGGRTVPPIIRAALEERWDLVEAFVESYNRVAYRRGFPRISLRGSP